MDRSRYLTLRYRVEAELLATISDPETASQLLNAVMRHFVEAESASEVIRQHNRRELLTFRRNPDIQPPSWAYRKPGTVPAFPTLR